MPDVETLRRHAILHKRKANLIQGVQWTVRMPVGGPERVSCSLVTFFVNLCQ
jgi:hypothetical protein